jgi:predicted aspartyl protease
MGTFRVRIEVAGPDRGRFESIEAPVDTGATYTVLPSRLLEDLRVVPHRDATFALADGRHVERRLGRAWIRIGAQEEYSLVVFGDDALLGAVTLRGSCSLPTRSGGASSPSLG